MCHRLNKFVVCFMLVKNMEIVGTTIEKVKWVAYLAGVKKILLWDLKMGVDEPATKMVSYDTSFALN